MPRNIDLTALRSFAAVAETGGVTRAAGLLNLTQSAVSMQLKRLEEALDLQLLDRSGRGVELTAAGEQLLGYARRILALNDEIYSRLTHQAFEGEIVLGVPHDIVYPLIPKILQRFNADYPRVKVQLVSSFTRNLKDQFDRGECDMILTTEVGVEPTGETLTELPLIWVGAPGGVAWKHRPLRLAYEHKCIFRGLVLGALEKAGIEWEMTVEADSCRTVEASVSADLAVHTVLEGTIPPYLEAIHHGGSLPDFPMTQVNLYVSDPGKSPTIAALADLVRSSFRPVQRPVQVLRQA